MQPQQQQQQQQPQQQPMFMTSATVFPQQQAIPGYVTVQGPVNPGIVHAYLSRQSKALGGTLIAIGVMAYIANAIGFGFGDYMAPVGHGFWSGTMFIITGAFGMGAASKRRCLIVTFMVMAILSAITTICLLGFGIGGAFDNLTCRLSYSYTTTYRCDSVHMYVSVAMEALLAFLAVAAAVVSIWGSVICCKAVCCCAPANYGMVIATPYGMPQMFVHQPGTAPYGYQDSQQVMSVPMSTPAYQMQQTPGGYPPTQQQYMPYGPHQSQYGFTASSAPPSDGPTASGVVIPVVSAPPPYTEVNDLKECGP